MGLFWRSRKNEVSAADLDEIQAIFREIDLSQKAQISINSSVSRSIDELQKQNILLVERVRHLEGVIDRLSPEVNRLRQAAIAQNHRLIKLEAHDVSEVDSAAA